MEKVEARPGSRMRAAVWLAVGAIMAAMYVVNGIQGSFPGYFVTASGWAVMGAGQAWSSILKTKSSGDGASGNAGKYPRLARYLSWGGLALIIVGLAMRWA